MPDLPKLSVNTINKMSKADRKKLGVSWVENGPSRGPNRRKPRRDTAIPRIRFKRLVKELMDETRSDLRIQPDAVEALQDAVEKMITHRFVRCARLADLCKRDTVSEAHWRYVEDSAAGENTLLG